MESKTLQVKPRNSKKLFKGSRSKSNGGQRVSSGVSKETQETKHDRKSKLKDYVAATYARIDKRRETGTRKRRETGARKRRETGARKRRERGEKERES